MGLESLIRESLNCICSAMIALLFVTVMSKTTVKAHKCIIGFAAVLALTKLIFVFYGNYLFLQPIISFIILVVYYALLNKSAGIPKGVLFAFLAEGIICFFDYAVPMLLSVIYQTNIDIFIKSHSPARLMLVFIANIFAAEILYIIVKLCKKSAFSFTERICNITLPILAGFVFMLMLNNCIANDRMSLTDYSEYVLKAIGVSAVCVCFYVAIYAVDFSNKKKLKENLQSSIAELETKRYDEMLQSAVQIKKLRHDLKNMLLPINMELNSGNIDDAREMLGKIIENANEIGNTFNTGNRVVDYILNLKFNDKSNRRIIVSGNALCISRISDTDLSVVLGNIIDNALEATENIDGAMIELSFFEKDGTINIVCQNSIERSVLAENPELETSKKEKSTHGFGISSIKKIADKYDGTVMFFEKNDMFGVHFMIPSEL